MLILIMPIPKLLGALGLLLKLRNLNRNVAIHDAKGDRNIDLGELGGHGGQINDGAQGCHQWPTCQQRNLGWQNAGSNEAHVVVQQQ